jgi:hypothetical protein
MLRLPAALPAALRFPSLGGTTFALCFAPTASSASPQALVPLVSRRPSPATPRWRRQDIPGSWKTLLPACPALRPRRDLHARPLRRVGAVFHIRLERVDPRNLSHFGAQSRGLQTRCLRFAARVTPLPRKTRFRLAANLCRAGLTPAGPRRKVSVVDHPLHPSSFPRLNLAHRRARRRGGLQTKPPQAVAVARSQRRLTPFFSSLLESASLRRLTTDEEGLRIFPFTADLEGAEVLEPRPIRSLRVGLPPELQLVEILNGDLAISKPIKEVVAERWREVCPLNLRHYSPKVIRASSSLRRFCSEASDE